MNKDIYDRLTEDYAFLQREKFEVYNDWMDGRLTTGQAVEKQRLIEERMQEIRDILLAKLDDGT